MIRMTRLHLINWHNFQDDIIDFKNITYLLGVNAVGKTTIMDAIRYCLTTNKDFNTAGNKKSGRTLLGSVHQKQRAEDSYLRPGHTVSYIGIEFLDENINKNFVITVRVESETPKQDLKGVYQDWYVTKPGFTLEDIPYFTEIKGGKRSTSRETFKLDNKGMDRASNQADARRRICRVLGIGEADSPIGKKFNEVFHMGTSLEDIKDIREFIYTYILPEPEVDIDFLQKDMRELERLQEILQEAQDREVLLAEINEKIVEAKARLSKVKVNEILVAFANYQGNVEGQQEKKRLVLQWTESISVLSDKLTDLSDKEKKATDLLYEAILFDYTDEVLEKDKILEFYNLYENPTYVLIKGNVVMHFETSVIDVSEMPDGIALSNASLEKIKRIIVNADKVITVENLTTYHDADEDNSIHIYLGGYHNYSKQMLLGKIYSDNKSKAYFHMGDLDVYGFLILENLKEKTGIPFKPLMMDVKTLERFYKAGMYKDLTTTDKKVILEKKDTKLIAYTDVLVFMLDNNCKVEQESIKAVELMQ